VTPAPRGKLTLEQELEVLHIWAEFLRDDVGQSVNALNNRLNAIRAALADLDPARQSPAERDAMATILRELDRAAGVTARLLHRIEIAAPDSVPHVAQPLLALDGRPAHVVVVEDDEANRLAIARLLRRFGLVVTPCANGVEALEVVALGGVECLITDVQMPTLGGRALYEQLEEQYPLVARCVVFVTGDYTEPATRVFLDRSGRPVVAKPYHPAELAAAVATVLQAGTSRGV
jgi:CheY-like chemotaxis protein